MPNQPPRRPQQGSDGRRINRDSTNQRPQNAHTAQMSAEQYAEHIRRQAIAKRKAQEKRRKMYMRRRIALIVLALCVIAGIFFGVKLIVEKLAGKAPPSSQMQDKPKDGSVPESKPQSSSQSASQPTSQAQPQSEPVSSSQPVVDNSAFPLATMVNANNPIPSGYVPETEKVDDAGHLFDTRAAAALKKMLSDGNATGLKLMICSAYRSNNRQTTLFNEMKDSYIAKGMSEQEAHDKTKTIRNVPGTSEHETALAADIVSVAYQTLDNGFEKTDEFKWLYKNCAEYGFILRYPSDKTAITGTIYEPWHYRYVGVDMAKEIMSQSICLEEYVEQKK